VRVFHPGAFLEESDFQAFPFSKRHSGTLSYAAPIVKDEELGQVKVL